MTNFNRKQHWEKIYQTKQLNEVSWYQPVPDTSLKIIEKLDVSPDAKIIDVGGGDSFLVDHLLDKDFRNITVLDISSSSIERAKQRLGEIAQNVKWIVADAANFTPPEKYDLWHDRAAFHFLTDEKEISDYVETAAENMNSNGFIIIGTFSDQGPKMCSGIVVKQYSEASMTERMEKRFEKIYCTIVDHKTPSGSVQNFIFCIFKKI
jgi:cyclopropane fatty-acyl-phospholipid synthase-like methyltransferase